MVAMALVACGPMGPSQVDDAGLPEWSHHCEWGADTFDEGASCKSTELEVACVFNTYVVSGMNVPGDECVEMPSHESRGTGIITFVYCCPPVSGLPDGS